MAGIAGADSFLAEQGTQREPSVNMDSQLAEAGGTSNAVPSRPMAPPSRPAPPTPSPTPLNASLRAPNNTDLPPPCFWPHRPPGTFKPAPGPQQDPSLSLPCTGLSPTATKLGGTSRPINPIHTLLATGKQAVQAGRHPLAQSGWQRAQRSVLDSLNQTHAQRNSTWQNATSHVPGTQQGIDLKRGSRGRFAWLNDQLSQVVSAQCVDFSADRLSVRDGLTNSDLITFLDKERPQWSRVRWINIDGMSWDVIKELALRYDLHPLAVEDMIHVPQRIKADFYDNFLYMSLTLVGLQPSAAAATAPELAAWDEWAQQTTHAERILRVDEMQAPRASPAHDPSPSPSSHAAKHSVLTPWAALAQPRNAGDDKCDSAPSSNRGHRTPRRSARDSNEAGPASPWLGPVPTVRMLWAGFARGAGRSVDGRRGTSGLNGEATTISAAESPWASPKDLRHSASAHPVAEAVELPPAAGPAPHHRHGGAGDNRADLVAAAAAAALMAAARRDAGLGADAIAIDIPASGTPSQQPCLSLYNDGGAATPVRAGGVDVEAQLQIQPGSAWRVMEQEAGAGGTDDLLSSHARPIDKAVRGGPGLHAEGRLLCRSGSMAPHRQGRQGSLPVLSTTLGPRGLQRSTGAVLETRSLLSALRRALQGIKKGTRDQDALGRTKQGSTQPGRVTVQVTAQQVCLILTGDGTLITMFEHSGQGVVSPLLGQLGESRTLVRDAQDASYLMNLVVDALVDHAYPVVDSYAQLIDEFEVKVMGGRPAAEYTRHLHELQGDLGVLKRTMAPTLRLVTTLRINAKGAATADAISGARSGAASAHRRTTSDAAVQQSAAVHMQKQLHQAVQQKLVSASKQKAVPLISHLTSTYLGDVQDHLSILIDALDSQSDQCRDLINLVFNLIAHGTNQSMQTLTVVSVLFLPLTFLAGIYGMNFDMPELHWTYGYEYFYGVCGVVLLVFLACIRRVMGGAMGVF